MRNFTTSLGGRRGGGGRGKGGGVERLGDADGPARGASVVITGIDGILALGLFPRLGHDTIPLRTHGIDGGGAVVAVERVGVLVAVPVSSLFDRPPQQPAAVAV